VSRAASLVLLLAACAGEPTPTPPAAAPPAQPASAQPTPRPPGSDLTLPGETHLRAVRQLTFGGQNAEAYWSWDDRRLVLQITDDAHVPAGERRCDQIFLLDVLSGGLSPVSQGGRTTCAYFLPGDRQLIYASTHEHGSECPPEPDRSQGYVWPLFDYDIFLRDLVDGSLRNLTNSPGYDAEATVAADGRIVFTSVRSGDIELWLMDGPFGTPRQLTHEPGYDGGAFFSADGCRLVWRASRPAEGDERRDYDALLARGLVRPTRLELFVADADGSHARQLTDNGQANFAPYFSPDGRSVLFASNMGAVGGRSFQIWRIGVDGTGLEQITHDPSGFNCFPMFSRDGTRLVFSSNRNGSVPHETNVFVAEWVP